MGTKEMRRLQTTAETVKIKRPGGTEMQRIRLPARRPVTGDGQGHLCIEGECTRVRCWSVGTEMTLCGDRTGMIAPTEDPMPSQP